MKKIIAFFTGITCFMMGMSAFAENWESQYPWAKTEVNYSIKHGILTGDEYGNLNLGDYLSQAEMAALITRTFSLKNASTDLNVKIDSSHWAYNNVAALSGYLAVPGAFSADDVASREQMASTLTSVIGYFDNDYDMAYVSKMFSDANDISYGYNVYIARAIYLDIIRGTDGRLNPKAGLKRAEALVMLYRAIDNPYLTKTPLIGDKQVSLEQAKSWARSKNADQRFIDIADIYWKYGALFGIRPEIMYAQAGKETGYGKYTGKVLPEMNNWAGIKRYGATGDATEDHETFLTPDDGVRGHFNHMSAYVGLEPIGVPHGRYYSVKSLSWAGTVKYAEQLGGKWCPDRKYGADIVKEVNKMMK